MKTTAMMMAMVHIEPDPSPPVDDVVGPTKVDGEFSPGVALPEGVAPRLLVPFAEV